MEGMNEASCIGLVGSFVECDDSQSQRTNMSGKLEAQQTATVVWTKVEHAGETLQDVIDMILEEEPLRRARWEPTSSCAEPCPRDLRNLATMLFLRKWFCHMSGLRQGEDEMKKEQVTTSGTRKEEEDSPSSLQNRIPHSI